MSLATVIEDLERIKGLSPQTRDRALMEVIDHYRMVVVPMHREALKKIDYKPPFEPAIERVIAGETTYKTEFERLGPAGFLNSNLGITGGNFDMEPQIAVVDRTIERLYGPRRSVPRVLTPEEAAEAREAGSKRSPLATIRLEPERLSGQRRLK